MDGGDKSGTGPVPRSGEDDKDGGPHEGAAVSRYAKGRSLLLGLHLFLILGGGDPHILGEDPMEILILPKSHQIRHLVDLQAPVLLEKEAGLALSLIHI